MKRRRILTVTFLIVVVLAFSLCVRNSNGDGVIGDKIDGQDGAVVSEPFSSLTSGIERSAAVNTDNLGSARGIVVTGEGRLQVLPDQAVLTVGVVNTGKTSQATLSANSETMSRVISALKNTGVDEKDIMTTSVNVWPEFDYGIQEGSERETPEIIGYRAENRVTVRVRAVAKTGESIDAATSAGANQIYGISFTVSDAVGRELRASAYGEAVKDATDKATAIATAIGAKSISPTGVVEGGGYTPPIYRYDVAALEKGAAVTPVSPGEVEVTAQVTMSFDFEI